MLEGPRGNKTPSKKRLSGHINRVLHGHRVSFHCSTLKIRHCEEEDGWVTPFLKTRQKLLLQYFSK